MSPTPIRVDPGRHTIICEQPGTDRHWTREVDVGSGETKRVGGTMLATLAVTLGIDAALDDVPYRKGQVAHLTAGRHSVAIAGGVKKWVDLRVACTVALSPDLDCYP